MAGWDVLEHGRRAAGRQRKAVADAQQAPRTEAPSAAAPPPEPLDGGEDLVALCRDVLGTRRGRKLLSMLRKRTKDRILSPKADACALWFREGQRQLVDMLERAVAAGTQTDLDKLRDELSKD